MALTRNILTIQDLSSLDFTCTVGGLRVDYPTLVDNNDGTFSLIHPDGTTILGNVPKADITDKDSLKPAFKDVEVVFHTAAFISLDKRYENLIRKINVDGTRNVCEASVDANIKKLIHFKE